MAISLRPYYQDGSVTLYHGDCVAALADMDDSSVDLMVTDPPYGVSYQSGLRNLALEPLAGDNSTEVALAGLKAALRVLRNGRHVYVFGRFDFAGMPLSKPTELIWDKGNMNAGNLTSTWGAAHEYIQFATCVKSYGNRAEGYGGLSARLRRGTVLRYDRLNSTQVSAHPTEKPVLLCRDLIEASSRFGDLVLDPFAGSGSTLLAAKLEGRRAIGIEVEERYCEIAANRLRQDVLPLEVTA